MEVVEVVKSCRFVKLLHNTVYTHLRWPAVTGTTQKVEGIQKVPLHPVNHPKTVRLIRVLLWGQRSVGHSGYLSHAFFHVLTSSGAYSLLSVKLST